MKLGKMNVYRKAMLMLMSMVLVTFIALGLVSMLGVWGVWRSTGTISEHFDDNVTNYAEEMAIVQTKKLMEENAVEKARQVERELSMVMRDTEFLANSMTRILTHPERYSPRQLSSPLEKRMAAGEAYLLISSAVKDECAGGAVQREIALASNAADDLELMASFYNDYQTSCYFGSKYGYYLSLECYDSDAMYNHIHTEAYHNSYDPRNRPWYQVAVAEGKAAFSDVYVGNDGYPEITCAVPYYNMDGFAGVAGLDVHLESLYRLISDRSLGKSNINFALNARGEVVFSSKEDGALAVSDGKHDLRKTAEASLARTAVNMTEGRSDIVMVNLDGSDYYLAYAPLPSVGWSFGTLLKVSEVLEPVAVVRESLSAHPEAFNVSVRSMFLKNVLRNILLVLAILCLFLYGISKVAKGFVRPILALTEGVRIIGKGNLERKLQISTGDEIEEISDSFDSITEKLKENMERLSKETEEKQKLVTEPGHVQGIRSNMMPNTLPESMDNPNRDIFAIKDAAKGDGGSFFDYKMNIRKSFLLRLVLVGILSLLVMGTISLWGLYDAQQDAMEKGRQMGAGAGTSLEGLTVYLAQRQLFATAEEKAHLVDRELRTIKEDTEYIALAMERILSTPEGRIPKPVRKAEDKTLLEGEAYVYYAPDIRNPAAQTALSNEIGIASCIADQLENTAASYLEYKGFLCVAAEKGYYFSAHVSPKEQQEAALSDVFLSSYVPKETAWYKNAERAGKTAVIDMVWGENTHLPFISCSVPYTDGKDFAGVANISISSPSLYQVIEDNGKEAPAISFALNDMGEIVFSSEKEGALSVTEEKHDLRKSSENALSKAAESMVAGKSGVDSVALNGESYYLAYVPIPSVGWSFGTLVKAGAVITPVQEVLGSVSKQEDEFNTTMAGLFHENLWKRGLLLVFILVLLVVTARALAERFAHPIILLRDGAREIERGNLEKEISISTGDEIEELSNAFSQMAHKLKKSTADNE